MIVRQENVQFSTYSMPFLKNTPELCLFFDIETTGLSWKRSHLYLLGVVFFENGQWIKKLWFCQKPSEEIEVLKEFSLLLNSRKHLIHFNGKTFDIPYLMHKYAFYQLTQSWEHINSIDLYQTALPFKKILGMEQMRQKDLEHRMGIFREDPYSGGELIEFYQNYLKSGDETLLDSLILHNSEDMDGLVLLLPILCLQTIFQGNLNLFLPEIQRDCAGSTLILQVSLAEALPFTFVIHTEFFDMYFESSQCTLKIPIITDTKKYFFSDYKNYYYLKYEDYAIHKSIGAYVDKEYRENAKANNCYQKKESDFLPIFDSVFTPMYKETHKDKWGWFEFTDEFLANSKELYTYISHLFRYTLPLLKES